jgi:DNA-binding transcriptional ArsR family regulator
MKAKNVVVALAALAQETRLAVFRLLVEQGPTGMAAGEIAASVDVSPAALSFHLKEMAHAGLVKSRQEGRFIFYSANFGTMNGLIAFLTENCCAADCGPGACAPAAVCATTSTRRAKPQRERTKA